MIISLRSHDENPVTVWCIDTNQVIAWKLKYPVAQVEGIQLILSSGSTLELSVNDTDNHDFLELVTVLSRKAKASQPSVDKTSSSVSELGGQDVNG